MSTAIAVHEGATLGSALDIERQRFLPVMGLELAIERREIVKQAVSKLMVESQDYGRVANQPKDVLLQPGAQKLDNLFGLVPRYYIEATEEDWTGEKHGGEPFFRYMVKCQCMRGDFVMGEGIGECNSWETKYRWRKTERKCPKCGSEAIIAGKKEYGGGWLCFKKKGGCGEKFEQGDPAIVDQEVGKRPNPEIFDQVNTLIKMAEKRAHMLATINATSASEFFTQDLDDQAQQDSGIDAGQLPAERVTASATDAGEGESHSRPAVKSPDWKHDLLKAFAGVKSDLKKLTGNDKRYYDVLGAHGYEKSDQIKTRDEGAVIFKELRALFEDLYAKVTQMGEKLPFEATDSDLPEILQGKEYPD